ncbi:MAG: hypothetical protein HY819_24880 [Acidobacteria bacterium]|nr:hypothetical protein [Acidobacteriota bacterium]
MSQKKTKPRVKSAKAEVQITENAPGPQSTIRSTPATRALRFLLGKDPFSDTGELDQEIALESSDQTENLISTENDQASSLISTVINPISTAINPISTVIEAPKNDLPLIENPRSDSEINMIGSPSRASSNIDGSQSQLTKQSSTSEKLTQSQLNLSQLTQSQLLASHQENLPISLEPLTLPKNDLIIEIPLPSRATPLGKKEASPITLNWRAIEHTRIPQVVFDEILPQLPPMAQTPYLQLLRLTLGFQRSSCHISLESWAARCNQSLASIKRQAAILQQRGLLKKESVVFGGSARGSYFCPVIPGVLNDDSITPKKVSVEGKEKPSQLTQSRLSASQLSQSQLPQNYMKEIDHDHENKIDHHEREVMMIYQDLTGNQPTLADLTAYRKISYLGAEAVIFYMRQVFERSIEPIGSFAYFTKAVEKATQEQQRSRAAQKRNLEKIVERIRQSRIGSRISVSEMVEEIKRACIRENVSYNNDLVNEILNLP